MDWLSVAIAWRSKWQLPGTSMSACLIGFFNGIVFFTGFNHQQIIAYMSPIRYNKAMEHEIATTDHFNKWFKGLKDAVTKQKILARFARIENGDFDDFKQIDSNLFELRFFFDGGFRIYYAIHDTRIVLLLIGGDKSSQSKDIKKAKKLLGELE